MSLSINNLCTSSTLRIKKKKIYKITGLTPVIKMLNVKKRSHNTNGMLHDVAKFVGGLFLLLFALSLEQFLFPTKISYSTHP